MNKVVSIIVPVYNVRGYINDCLESILKQDYKNIEVVLVDDGSTDGSGEICDEYANEDQRVRVFHKKNGGPGPSSARNFGLKKAKGEFVCFVDSDDVVKNNYISRMMEAMDESVDIVVGGYNNVVPDGKVLSGKEATEKLLVLQDNLEIVVWGKIYRREIFEGITYPVREKYEDSLTAYKVLAKARNVVYVPEILYEYRERKGSIMDEAEILERLNARQKAAEEAVKYFGHDKNLKKAAEVAVLTAKYAFVDAAIRKEINKKFYDVNEKWIKGHKLQYKDNKYVTKKLKLYNFLTSLKLYKVFRTIV